MKTGRKPESRATKAKREDFYEEVLSKGPCYWQQFHHHECHSIIDPMHLIPKQFLKQYFSKEDPDDLASIIWDADNGVPGCRFVHSQIDNKMLVAHFEWLPDEAVNFAWRHGVLWRLEHEFPRKDKAA